MIFNILRGPVVLRSASHLFNHVERIVNILLLESTLLAWQQNHGNGLTFLQKASYKEKVQPAPNIYDVTGDIKL